MARIPRRKRAEDETSEPRLPDEGSERETGLRDAEWGVAPGPPRGGPATHYQAARLPELGDIVVAVTRILDPVAIVPERHELRAISATAPDRARLLGLAGEELLAADGALGWAEVDLRGDAVADPWPDPARRIARLSALRVTGPTPGARAVHAANGLADWLLTLVESELAFATWLGLEGAAPAFDGPGDDTVSPERALRTGDFGTWGADWLEQRGYAVDRTPPGTFRRTINAPLLARLHGELRA